MKRFVSSTSSPSNIWCSFKAPNVQIDKACVCPRVNNADPCVRGNKSTRDDNGRISSILRPSGRTFSSVIKRSTYYLTILFKNILTCFNSFSVTSSASNTSNTRLFTASIAS